MADVSMETSVAPWSASLGCAAVWIAGTKAQEEASKVELRAGDSALLGSSRALSLPHSFCVHCTAWGRDPVAPVLGPCGFATVSTRLEDYDALAESLQCSKSSAPVMLFAGEATTAVHAGTRHRACFNGRPIAQQLLEAWQP